MDNITQEEIVIKACKIAAIKHFNQAMIEANGPDYEKFKSVTVEEFIDMVAQNGIRVCFSREWHMNRLNPALELLTESVNAILKDKP